MPRSTSATARAFQATQMGDLRLSCLTFNATVSCLKSRNNSTSQVFLRVLEGFQPRGC